MENVPRRTFLKGMLAAGAMLAAPKLLVEKDWEEPRDVVEFSEPHTKNQPWESGDMVHADEEKDLEAMTAFCEELTQFSSTFQRRFGFDPRGASDSEHEQVISREAIISSLLLEKLDAITEIMSRYPSTRGNEARLLYEDVLQVFSACNAQGLVFDAMKKRMEEQGGEICIERSGQYYASRLQDYVPTTEDIWSQDIDPRNKPEAGQAARQRMQDKPGWSGKQRKKLFRKLASDPRMIEMGQREDLTLAEYFSFVKACIHERQQSRQEALGDLGERLLDGRRELMERSVVDASTEQAIIFAGNDARYFEGDQDESWDATLESAGVKPDRVNKIATSEGHTNAETLSILKKTIASSEGKTFLAFSTHGAEQHLGMDHRAGEGAITDAYLAEALLARVIEQRNPTTLADMTIVMDACHTYEFSKNVMVKMKEIWDSKPPRPFPFSRIHFPCMVAGVQEGSVGQASSTISRVLQNQGEGVRKDGRLSGKRLLQNVQPISYEENDMTFFATGTGTEFASRSTLPNERSV